MGTSRHQWVAFDRLEEGAAYLHQCNMHFADAPSERWPTTAVIGMAFEACRKNGLPTPAEYDRALKIETVLRNAMEKSAHAVHLATITGDGGRMWIFQCKTASATERRLAALPARIRDPLTCHQQNDPDWTLYFESLLPTELESMRYNNSCVLAAMAESGDNPRRARPIEHLAYFPTAAARKKFQSWAKRGGFTIDESPAPDSDATDDLPFRLFFSMKSKADLDAITDQTHRSAVAARTCGGMYDGWESAIVPKK